MKRLTSQPITAFFQRKQPRLRSISIESVDSDDSSGSTDLPSEEIADEQEEEKTANDILVTKRNAHARREHREDLTGILHRRELVGCASTRLFIGGFQGPRRRRKQQLVRWALTHFQRLPVTLQLAPHWERQAGVMNSGEFYASCLEFDAQGVLLVAGASNGIIALYDFDDVSHRSLNLGQRLLMQQDRKDEEEVEAGETEMQEETKEEIVHPIHTIFTPFEVKCIRWNPINEDEIACSFSNRNEIHLFNLRKFPSKPHKIVKSSNHPSSGYNDLLYLATNEATLPHSRQPGIMKQKSRSQTINIVAGDMDGAIRMWDVRFPARPIWSFVTGSKPINAILLSPNQQFIICGSEAGILMTYDIQHKIVPAFGLKPVPQRMASINVMEAIKPYISPACIESMVFTNRSGSPGIVSMRLMPHSETQVLCQLRNDWVVIIDYLLGSVVKLHTFIRGVLPRQKAKPDASPNVLSVTSEIESHRSFLPRQSRNSWLSCHRCRGAFLFDNSIMCTGIHDATSLNVIDMHQLQRVGVAVTSKRNESDEDKTTKVSNSSSNLPAVERLDRFRIPMNSIITAVAAHPNQQSVICGGESMSLQVMGVLGPRTKST